MSESKKKKKETLTKALMKKNQHKFKFQQNQRKSNKTPSNPLQENQDAKPIEDKCFTKISTFLLQIRPDHMLSEKTSSLNQKAQLHRKSNCRTLYPQLKLVLMEKLSSLCREISTKQLTFTEKELQKMTEDNLQSCFRLIQNKLDGAGERLQIQSLKGFVLKKGIEVNSESNLNQATFEQKIQALQNHLHQSDSY